MSHWKIGVKILCSKSWEGQNSMKAKIWGSKFYFFLVEPLVKILCSLKRGVKILYFFPVPWKRGGQNRGAYQPTSPPGSWPMGKPIWANGQITMTVHNYRSRQVHGTLNGVHPSNGFRDMRSAKSGPNLWQIWQVYGPWASPYGANGLKTMTVHN